LVKLAASALGHRIAHAWLEQNLFDSALPAFQPIVFSQIDRAHTARPDKADNLVPLPQQITRL
jgi:hypothetical protein